MENSAGPIALVVPCYNEAARLNIQEFRNFAAQMPGIHLLFVDDGSRDKTLSVLQTVREGNESNVSILPSTINVGKAQAVRRGILHALDHLAPRIVGFWDADLATPLDAVAPLARVLGERPDIEMVFGARVKLLGREVERRAIRHYPGRVFATMVSLTLQLSIYDSQCGAKLFRVQPHTRPIFADPFFSKWIFDVEILARYRQQLHLSPGQLAALIYEYPLEKWTDVAGSKIHPGDFAKSFVDLLRINHAYPQTRK
jgi:glycosyltransferase involved in cell wall biosynthesis